MNVFEQIKSKISIYEYISKFVRLKSSAGKLLGLCPFHAEKTPSFYVDASKNLFHCFGCQAGGDIFDFYMKYHHVDKKEALYALASIAQINLEKKVYKKNDLQILNEFFIENLKNNEKAFEFLLKRGLKKEYIQKFEIGVATSFEELIKFIEKNELKLDEFGFSNNTLKMFANRIVFPIYNKYSKILSFAGRILPNSSNSYAKYLNGPSSKHFAKSKVLYGMHLAKSYKPIYIVEGYLDVILMHQNEYQAVASMGTSFTNEHLDAAFECSNNLIVAMDGDIAGKNSAIKIAYSAIEKLSSEKTIKFIEFPDNEDPASWLEKNNLDSLKEYALYEYIFMHEYSKVSLGPEYGAKAFNNLMEVADKIQDPILKSEYKKRFRSLWWSKKKPVKLSKVLNEKHLVLLLFKYILLYPDILDEVSEQFVRLPFEELFDDQFGGSQKYMNQVDLLLNNNSIDDWLVKQIDSISLIDKVSSKEDALKAWKKVAAQIESLNKQELKKMSHQFEENFSQEEWDKYKNWIASIQKED